jgi:hypothetical protein
MQGYCRHRVEEAAIVADQDQGAAVVAQKSFEPQCRLEVEMVRRLVEQQQVGLGEEDRRERNPHAPAARQICDGPALHGVVETEPGEDARGPALRRMSVDLDQPGLDLGNPQRVRSGLSFGQQAGTFSVGGKDRFERVRLPTRRLLREKPDPIPARQFDRSAIRLQCAADQVQQGRFAGAVAPDQTDLAALGDLCARLVDERPPPDAVCQAGDGQHRQLLAQRRGVRR